MRIKSKAIFKTLLLAAFLGLSFLASEILLRIFWEPPVDTRDSSLVEYHPLYGWQKTPYAKATHRNGEYTVVESYNSKGLRGPEYSYQKQAHETRILVLGDSHAEGHSVKFEDLFSEVLKRNLNQKGPGSYEVINTGTGGYGTDQELLFFKNEGKKYRPDLTILAFSVNNVWYNSLNTYASWHKPLFEFKDGKLRLTGVPVPKPDRPSHDKIRQFFKNHIYTGKFIYQTITHSDFYVLLSQWGLTPFPNQFRVWQKNESPQIHEAWKLTEALLVELKQSAELSGNRLLVFYIPIAAEVHPAAWEEKKRKYGWSEAEWDPLQDGRELEAICRKQAIDFLNPVERFRQEAAQQRQEKLYSFKDEHWVRDGHRLAGHILTEYLKEHDFIKLEKT